MSGLTRTDVGNGIRFARQHGDRVRYLHPWKCWYVWDGQRWKRDALAEVEGMAKETARSIYRDAEKAEDEQEAKALGAWAHSSEMDGRRRAMLAAASSEPGIPVLPEQLDRDPWLLNTPSGTVQLRTGQLRAHRQGDLITKTTAAPFDPVAECPRWLAFLERIFAGNAGLIGFAQRLAGYALTGDVSEHVLPILHGNGRNGKSVFLDALLGALGDYAMPAPTDLLMVKPGESHPTAIASLHGMRLVSCVETEEGRRLAEGLVKSLTGGDRITARRMREDNWSFTPTHKLLMATNHRPVIKGTDEGIWRRLRLVPFSVTIPLAEQDPKLGQRLRAEWPGILRWAVAGCLEWQAHGLGEPAEVTAASAGYRAEMDVLGGFIADCCVLSHSAKSTAATLYSAYRTWCQENGEREVSQRKFGLALSERGLDRRRSTGGQHVWDGIGLGVQAANRSA